MARGDISSNGPLGQQIYMNQVPHLQPGVVTMPSSLVGPVSEHTNTCIIIWGKLRKMWSHLYYINRRRGKKGRMCHQTILV